MKGHFYGGDQPLMRLRLVIWACSLFKMREENKIARRMMDDFLIDLQKPDFNVDKGNVLHFSLAPPKV